MLELSTKSSDDEEVLCSCSTDLARAANLWIGGRLISLVERLHGICGCIEVLSLVPPCIKMRWS